MTIIKSDFASSIATSKLVSSSATPIVEVASTFQVLPSTQIIGTKVDLNHQQSSQPPPITPTPPTTTASSPSLMKLATERMKRKFLGWN
jgi:hypothetical protein